MNEHDLLDAVGGIDGKYVDHAANGVPQKQKKHPRRTGWVVAVATMAAALALFLGISALLRKEPEGGAETQMARGTTGSEMPGNSSQGGTDEISESPGEKKSAAQGSEVTLANASFQVDYDGAQVNYRAVLEPYTVNADLSNVKDIDRYWFREEQIEKLAANCFVVTKGQSPEFFDIYESNRYLQYPSFITADSMMHTFHLYFAMLQKKVEKQALYGAVERMTTRMLENAKQQYEVLKGSEWEEAAKLNVAYFGIASRLMELDGQVPDEAADIVSKELQKINGASGIEMSLIMNDYEDYSQYQPRGYYDGDAGLERYFRTMTLYGHLNYAQSSETMNRCALLTTLSMKGDEACRKEWGDIYDVTAFFVGQSDDLGYYEYLPVINEAYGKDVTVKELIGDQDAFRKYVDGIKELHTPGINSVVFEDDGGETDKREASKGFRFMGQRFTMDAAVFTQLTYSQVKQSESGSKRLLPDGLDVPAAFGSDQALDLLIQKGNDQYPNYLEKMEKVRAEMGSVKGYWSSSLYGGWLYTLWPLLEEKGAGYPSFMTNREWQKKSLEGYLGSWTELKHDTILYSKQSMAEMGGGDGEIFDDRGYVEPQPELFARLYALTRTTREGLEARGFLGEKEKEGLERLAALSKRFRDISVKELQDEKLSEDDYEMIRDYGGSLEHLWYDTVKDEADNDYADSAEFPMALVADVATDPNGTCLEEAIGGAARIYVIFPIDGELHIGIGGVFNYYQFVQPISNRLTDKEWRIRIGMQLDDNGVYRPDRSIQGPSWTRSYR